MKETFTYDDMNRLTGITLSRPSGQDLACAVTYDALGRMTSKQAVTAVNGVAQVSAVFSQPVFNAIKVHAVSSAQSMSDMFPTGAQNITYTSFEKAGKIKLDMDSICYTYGYDQQRIGMEEYIGSSVRTKQYVGSCEYITETGTSGTKTLTYLTGPYGVFAVVEKQNNAETLHYILKDNLGSWTTITNGNGAVEQRLSFDAWGNQRNPNTWANYTANDTYSKPMFDRGFTGHEHYDRFKVVNANARLYDPVIGCFFSPDPYVQAPDFTQNYNRYSYCLNNPVMYSDPTGEVFGIDDAIIICGAIIGAYFGGALANGGNYNPTRWDWGCPTTYLGIIGGGVAGGLSSWAGIGIAGTGVPFCNTAAIASSSLIYSSGMHLTGLGAGFDYDISVSIGFASYNFTQREFGYLLKKGNSILDNIGYGLGAFTNICDMYRFATWDILSSEKKLEIIKNTVNDPEITVTYDRSLNKEGQYNKETGEMTIGRKGLRQGKGWAQSTLQHEYKHHIDICNGLGSKDNAFLDWRAYCYELQNAERNGLTISQHQDLIRRATNCANNLGQPIGNFPKYTLLEWLRSLIYL